MKAPLIALFAMLMFAAPPLAAAQVNSVEVHAGWVNLDSIVSGDKALPLSEPTVALEPAFRQRHQVLCDSHAIRCGRRDAGSREVPHG